MTSLKFVFYGLLLTTLSIPCHVYSLGMTVIEGDVYIELIASIYTKVHKNGTCYEIDKESMQNVESIRWVLKELNKFYINSKGIGLRISATCKSAERAENLAFQLANEMSGRDKLDVIGVLGGDNSDEALRIARLLSAVPPRYQLPVVSYRATSPSLNNEQLPNFIRTIPSDLIQTEIMLKFMKDLNWTYLAIVHDNNTYGIDGSNTLKENVRHTDICFPVTISFDRDTDTEEWLESELNKHVYNAAVPIGGVIVFGDASLRHTVLHVTENIELLYPNITHPVMLFSDGGIDVDEHTLHQSLDASGIHQTRYGTFSLSPPRRNISEFQNDLKKIFQYPKEIYDLPDKYSDLMKELYESYFGCRLPSDISNNQCRKLTSIEATVVPSIYNQYAIQSTLTLARIEQIVRGRLCPSDTFCTALLNISRKEYAKHTRQLTVDLEGFSGLIIAAFRDENSRFIIEFSNSCEAVLPEKYPKYEIYQDQPYGSNFNITTNVKVAYLANELELLKANIKDYDEHGNELIWPNIRKPQCPTNFSCPLCIDKMLPSSMSLFEDGDMYVVGIVPVHNRGDSPLECGPIKAGMLDVVEAIRFAINEAQLNFADKIPNARIGLIVIDSCNDAHIIQERMINLHRQGLFINGRFLPVADRIIGYVGGLTSGSSAKIADICALLGCVQISYASTSVSLSNRITYPNFLRIPGSDSRQADAILTITKELGWDVIQIVHSDTTYGNSGKRALQEKAYAMKICISKVHKFASDTSPAELFTDIRQVIDVKTIVLYLSLFDVYRIIDYINKHINSGEFVFICSDGWGKSPDISTHTALIGSITLTPELPISDKFKEHMKQLNPDRSDVDPWIRPYMEYFFNCYYEWSFDKSSGSECTGKESLDVYRTNYKINVWSPFAEKATLSLLQGARRALDQLCGNSTHVCATYKNETEKVVAEVKKTRFNDDSGNMVPVFDDNGDGLAGYTFYAIAPGDETMKYKPIGSSMPVFVFDKASYRELGVDGSRCTGQKACDVCIQEGSTETTVYPGWLIALFVIISLVCAGVVGYLLYMVYRRGCCIRFENGLPRPVAGYLTPADLVNRRETVRQSLESAHYLSLSECIENEYDHTTNATSAKCSLNPVFNSSINKNRLDKPAIHNHKHSKSNSYEVPVFAAISLPSRNKPPTQQTPASTLDVCIENPVESRRNGAETPVGLQEPSSDDVTVERKNGSRQVSRNTSRNNILFDETSASTIDVCIENPVESRRNGAETPVESQETSSDDVTVERKNGSRQVSRNTSGNDILFDETVSSDNNGVFTSTSSEENPRQLSNSSYVIGNIPVSVSSYAQISEKTDVVENI